MSEPTNQMSPEMTQLNQAYTSLCTQLGDLVYKVDFVKGQISKVQAQFEAAAAKQQAGAKNGPTIPTASPNPGS